MMIAWKMVAGRLAVVAFLLLLLLIIAWSPSNTHRNSSQQYMVDTELRIICQHLDAIRSDVDRLERLEEDRDTRIAFGSLSRHLRDLRMTIDRGTLSREW
jgi:hypothetical protein